MTHQEMAPEKWNELLELKNSTKTICILQKIDANTDDFTCRKCKSKMQLLSASNKKC